MWGLAGVEGEGSLVISSTPPPCPVCHEMSILCLMLWWPWFSSAPGAKKQWTQVAWTKSLKPEAEINHFFLLVIFVRGIFVTAGETSTVVSW